MPRGFNPTAKTESALSYNSLATLVEVLVDPSDPLYLTDYARDISHDSKTWTSAQGMIGISAITENSSNGIETLSLSLSGVPEDFVSLFLDYNYVDRAVKIHKVFLDAAGAVVGNSMLCFDGRIDQPVIKHEVEKGTATVLCQASSHWIDYSRSTGRTTNDAQQQHASNFPSDDCFKFSIDYEKEIKWGQPD